MASTSAAVSHVGKVRSKNDDSGYAGHHLFVVADGMGGHAGGEIASHLALETVLETFRDCGFDPTEALLADALHSAHERIQREAGRDDSKSGMGTTLVAAALREGAVWVAHIGDSRALQFRAPCVRRLTQDHLFAVDILGISENRAKLHPHGNVLSQALGSDCRIAPAINHFDLASGDIVLLCSDGVSEWVSEPLMWHLLAEHTLDDAIHEIVQAALSNGSRDNCTALAAAVPIASSNHELRTT
jgi:PPM family protein phosphatase